MPQCKFGLDISLKLKYILFAGRAANKGKSIEGLILLNPEKNRGNSFMHLRPVIPGDAPALAKLYDLVWSKEVHILGERLAAERRADELIVRRWLERDAYFVVEIEGAMVSALGCEEKHGTLHLVHLVTHLDYRRRGYAFTIEINFMTLSGITCNHCLNFLYYRITVHTTK